MSFLVNISGDKRILQKFDEITKLVKDMRAPLKEAGKLILDETDKVFETEGSRMGKKWTPLTQATLIQKARLGYGSKRILERTGHLRKSFEMNVSKFVLRVFSEVDYYKYHQLGGVKLPKRPMLVATENIKQNIIETIHKALRKTYE